MVQVVKVFTSSPTTQVPHWGTFFRPKKKFGHFWIPVKLNYDAPNKEAVSNLGRTIAPLFMVWETWSAGHWQLCGLFQIGRREKRYRYGRCFKIHKFIGNLWFDGFSVSLFTIKTNLRFAQHKKLLGNLSVLWWDVKSQKHFDYLMREVLLQLFSQMRD